MASTHTPTSKRKLTLGELMIVNAAFALDLAALGSGSAGLVLLASWWAFAIAPAVILLYVPRGLDWILVDALIAARLLTIPLSEALAGIQRRLNRPARSSPGGQGGACAGTEDLGPDPILPACQLDFTAMSKSATRFPCCS